MNFHVGGNFLMVALLFALFPLIGRPAASLELEMNQFDSDRPVTLLVSLESCCIDMAWSAAERRLRQELFLSGIDVIVIEGVAAKEESPRNVLKDYAMLHRSVAAIRIRKVPKRSAGLVELYVNDRESPTVTYRELEIAISEEQNAAEVAAIRAAEAVRAILYELQIIRNTAGQQKERATPIKPKDEMAEPKIRAGEQSPSPEPETTKKETSKSRTLQGLSAFTVTGTPGRAGFLGALDAALRWSPIPVFTLSLDCAISLFGQNVEANGGEATVDMFLTRLIGAFELEQDGLLRPNVGFAGGFAYVWTAGLGEGKEYEAKKVGASGAYLGAIIELGLVVSDRVWFFGGVHIGFLLPGFSIHFAGEPVAEFGIPLIEGRIGLALTIL